jgi:phenylpyruvate tautomerase PptA (4-oxalocrotonate tautomerase family)
MSHPFQFQISDITYHVFLQWMRRLSLAGISRRSPDMPLVCISLRRGKPPQYRKAIADGVYDALRETFSVPEHDRFMLVSEHDGDDFDCDPHYFGIERSQDLVILQLTVSNTRTQDQKKALYRRIVDRLGDTPGVRPQDVFINLVEVNKENWSFGNGEAQYA